MTAPMISTTMASFLYLNGPRAEGKGRAAWEGKHEKRKEKNVLGLDQPTRTEYLLPLPATNSGTPTRPKKHSSSVEGSPSAAPRFLSLPHALFNNVVHGRLAGEGGDHTKQREEGGVVAGQQAEDGHMKFARDGSADIRARCELG